MAGQELFFDVFKFGFCMRNDIFLAPRIKKRKVPFHDFQLSEAVGGKHLSIVVILNAIRVNGDIRYQVLRYLFQPFRPLSVPKHHHCPLDKAVVICELGLLH